MIPAAAAKGRFFGGLMDEVDTLRLPELGQQVAEQMSMSLIVRFSGRHFLLLSDTRRFIAQPELAEIPAQHPGKL